MNEKSQLHGFTILALLGPIVAVGFFQVMMDEPANAGANTLTTEFLSLPEIPRSSDQSSDIQPVLNPVSSPFWFEEVEMSLPVMPMISRPTEPNAVSDPIFTLSAVLPSPSGSFAVINGKAHSEGDEIMTGWKLVRVAGKERYVIVQHSSGRRVRVQMSR